MHPHTVRDIINNNRVEAVKRLAEAEKELARARNDRHAAAEEVKG